MERKIHLSWHDLITHFWNVLHVETFDGECFTVQPMLQGRGFVFVDKQSGQIKEIPEIFYAIKCVYDHSQRVIARRSRREAELILYLRVNADSYRFENHVDRRNRKAIFPLPHFKQRVGNVRNEHLISWVTKLLQQI